MELDESRITDSGWLGCSPTRRPLHAHHGVQLPVPVDDAMTRRIAMRRTGGGRLIKWLPPPLAGLELDPAEQEHRDLLRATSLWVRDANMWTRRPGEHSCTTESASMSDVGDEFWYRLYPDQFDELCRGLTGRGIDPKPLARSRSKDLSRLGGRLIS